MSDMNCPICGKDLVEIELDECRVLVCCNSKCRCSGVASDTVWKYLTVAIKNRKALSKELIRTGKALDVAVDALGYYASENSWDETNRWMFVENGFEFAKDVLEQITALTKGAKNE